TCRVVRANSGTPSSRSRRATIWLTWDLVYTNRSAARPKWSSSATATKQRRSDRSIVHRCYTGVQGLALGLGGRARVDWGPALGPEGDHMNLNDLVLVSIDDHVIEPPDLFGRHMPARFRSEAPHVERRPDGSDRWLFQGTECGPTGLGAVATWPRHEW